MAAKSMTVRSDATIALAALREFAASRSAVVDEAVLQNGTRIRITGGLNAALNLYPSKGGGCKIVFDRPDTADADAIAVALGAAPSIAGKSNSAGGSVEPVLPDARCWVGSDESGKGDYFGPLVVAAVALDDTSWRVLQTMGVQDSKNLTDARASALAAHVRDVAPYEVVTIMPARYNELWQKFGNVNRVLAWAHARAIEVVLERVPEATAAVADQFGDESLIERALFERGRQVRLVQMPRAERDPAVAAASILARAEFLRRLDQLGRDAGIRLPKGASAAVDAVARGLVQSRGRDVLRSIAKEHFKTTQRAVR